MGDPFITSWFVGKGRKIFVTHEKCSRMPLLPSANCCLAFLSRVVQLLSRMSRIATTVATWRRIIKIAAEKLSKIAAELS